MFLRHIFHPTFMWENPDPAGGGGAGTAAPGTPPPGQGQPAANDGFWGNFPNVPAEARGQLEPHLRDVQGYVTSLEQAHAPFKQFAEAGLDDQAAGSLIKFSADFERDPLTVWLNMGRMLQQANGGLPVLDPEIDIDHLAAMAAGEDTDAGGYEGYGQPVGQPAEGDVSPQVMQYIQKLQDQVKQLSDGVENDRVTRQTQVQDQLYERRMGQMREAVKKTGYPEELLTDEKLTATILVHKGDMKAATQSLVDERTALLRGSPSVQRATGGQPQSGATMPNGAPPTPPRVKPNHRDGTWGKARETATARLRRENIAAAQGDQ